MRFVLVNGERPRKKISCMLCREPFRAGYLREIGSGKAFCDHDCYLRSFERVEGASPKRAAVSTSESRAQRADYFWPLRI
jgi:hypothetical protein